MNFARVALRAGIVVGLIMSSSCGSKPEGFQNACDHLSAAISAADDGDLGQAEDELNAATNWMDAAFEDTSGSERDAVHTLSKGLAEARAYLGDEAGQRGMAAAASACS